MRQVVIAGLSAAATAVLPGCSTSPTSAATQPASPPNYLLMAVADFGLGVHLARTLGAGRPDHGRTTRAVMDVQLAFSVGVSLVAVALAVAAGPATARGAVTLAVIPTLIAQSWAPLRQVYYANYRTGQLGVIDVTTNVANSALVIGLAALGAPPVVVALVFSSGAIANVMWVHWRGRDLLAP